MSTSPLSLSVVNYLRLSMDPNENIIPNRLTSRKIELYRKSELTEEIVKTKIEELTIWMRNQSQFPDFSHINLPIWLENQVLVSKGNIEKAKHNIGWYFKARISAPMVFQGRDAKLDVFTKSYENVTLALLDGLTPRGHKVLFFRINSSDPQEFDLLTLMRRVTMVLEVLMTEESEASGYHVVADAYHQRLSHISRLSFGLMKAFPILMKSYPIRITAINVLNRPWYFPAMLQVFKPFLSSKVVKRISFPQNIDELRHLIGDVKFPDDFSFQKRKSDEWRNKLQRFDPYLKKCDAC